KQTPEQMWKEYKYTDLFPPPTPPKKPCFLAGTLVKTESGLVAIETIKTGTKVLSFNFETQKTEYQTVVQTFSNYAEKYLALHTEKDVLKVTGAHLFYVPKENKWIAASQLKLDMQLIDAQQNLVAIKKLVIIKEDVPTYNLEVAQNHNYYAGEDEILTHNDSKKLKFTNTELFYFEFYEYLDYNNKPTYVGQTTQGLTKRADQHLTEYNKTPAKKEFVGISKKLPQELIINGKPGPFKMTPFEAAITEMYELNTRGGKRINGKGLFNKKNPVSKRTFDKIKKDFPNFNPCRYYV
ncbi:polymorphic toxin-type HINT domain-containing protein, partial [Flavobacterium sp.]|uniref:polymorphic toxin-type HINT domain-containing protein n=1 Tax=Flavobacterium sp. TaxID=239 RepID=UPI003527BA31